MPVAFSPSLLASIVGVPRGLAGSLLAAVLAGGAIFLLFLIRRHIVQTTLASAWAWSVAALAALGTVEIWFQGHAAGEVPLSLPAFRYLAGVLSLCPIVSVLGAKRPQDRAWNFVVLALWGIVSLPALMWLAIGRGEAFQLSDLRGIVLWILLALPAVNYLSTQFFAAALIVVLGQLVLLAPHLPLIGSPLLQTDPGLVSLLCFGGAALVVWSRLPRLTVAGDINRQWLVFRDEFGLFWALRVQERMNAADRQRQWPVYLSWSGFRNASDHQLVVELPQPCRQAVTQTFRQLLRRFAAPGRDPPGKNSSGEGAGK